MNHLPSDYYERLGVAAQASIDEITQAFRRMAMRYHPDRNKDQDAMRHFIEIREAFDILRDPQKRSVYDRIRSASAGGAVVVAASESDRRHYGEWRSEARSNAERDAAKSYEEFTAWLKQFATKVSEGAQVGMFFVLLAVGGVVFSLITIGVATEVRGPGQLLIMMLCLGAAAVCFVAFGAAIKDMKEQSRG
jgi:hypothetical protein